MRRLLTVWGLLLIFTSFALAQQPIQVTTPTDTIVSDSPSATKSSEPSAHAHTHAHTDTPAGANAIYQGMILKLDIGSTVVAVATSLGKIQHYEIAMNWRLINRLYPTFELGYAGGNKVFNDTIAYNGHGGFFRVGLDINPLKKNSAISPHALLVGLRLGTAIQGFNQELTNQSISSNGLVMADCWGEIVVGCQVNIVKGLYMGWFGRLKCLFTRYTPTDEKPITTIPQYIPGFGNRDEMGWGVDYHLGYRF